MAFWETLNFHRIFALILKIQFKMSYYPICRWKETIHGQESATKMQKCTFFTKENLGKMMKLSLRGFASLPPTILCSKAIETGIFTRLTNICTIQMTLNFLIIINIVCTSKKSLKRRVFLLRQLCMVNYCVQSSSNNLSNENISTGVSVV